MRHLLDTDAVSDLVKRPGGRVAARVEQAGDRNVSTSIIVAGEVRSGAAKPRSAKLLGQAEIIPGGLEVHPFADADRIHGAVRAHLEAAGRPIGANDMLIAAHASALGCTLVTDNVRGFSRVPALVIENWLR